MLSPTSQDDLFQPGNQHLHFWLGITLRQYVNVNGPRADVPTSHFRILGNLRKEAFQMREQRKKTVTTELLYLKFMDTPSPSRVEMNGDLPSSTVCKRMYNVSDTEMVEFYFQVLTNTLPTKAKLHHLNPRRHWEEALVHGVEHSQQTLTTSSVSAGLLVRYGIGCARNCSGSIHNPLCGQKRRSYG